MRMTASRVYMRPQPVPKMPPGMVELMEGLTRDVLKNNPPDVYGFCANHMQKLLEIRDGPVFKRPLTLEEKIVRVQQKLRERAEQRRRRQYDKDIKLGSSKKNAKAKAENSQEIIAISSIEEIEAQINSEPVAESSLKAPVHHEHELSDALEIEIYHKSSGDSQTKPEVIEDFKMTKNKEIKEFILDKSRATEEQNNENQALKEPVTTSNDSTIFEVNDIRRKVRSSSMDENEIQNPIYIQKPRSVEDITGNVKEINKKLEQKKIKIVQTQSAEHGTSKQLTAKNDDFEDKSHDNFDYTQTVTNESVNKFENDQEPIIQKELEDDTDVFEIQPQKNYIQNTNFIEDTGFVVKLIEGAQEQSEVKDRDINTTEVVNVDDMKQSEDKENMDVMLSEEKFNTTAKTTSDKNLNEECNIVKNITNENASDDIDKPEVNLNVNEKPHEHHENPSSTKMDCRAENYIPADIKEVEGGVKEDKEPEDTSDSIHTNNSDGTISEHRVLVVELADVKDDNASVPEHNGENYIRYQKVNGCNLTDTPVDVINEDSERDFFSISEADSEGPDTYQLLKDVDQTIHERSKRNLENISQGIDNTSYTLDVGKSDNEAISLSKFSSMDDSAPEDGNDIVGNEIKTNGKSSNHTSAMDLETAAVTIQKVFRTFLFKSRASTEDSVNDDNNFTDEDTEKVDIDLLVPPPTNMKERRGIARMDTVLQTVNEEKSLSLSTDDSSLSGAATVIQAHVRGFLVRNKLNSNKTASSASLVNSDGHSTSLEAEVDQNKPNKTVLNIIVPEGGHFLSRDESVLTSMDLSLDGSPPSSVNLHPLGYDKSEPRKQLKRGDAIQSISPPSNNSGKLSEDIDSVKEICENDFTGQQMLVTSLVDDIKEDADANSRDTTPTKSTTVETVVEAHKWTKEISSLDDKMSEDYASRGTLTKMSSDESDVVTPFEEKKLTDSDNTLGLLHSGEFHDVVLPTKISRSETSVVRGE